MAIDRVKFGQQLIQRYTNVCRVSSGCTRRKNLFQPPQRVGGPQSTTRSCKDTKLDLGSLKSNLLLRWAINVEKEDIQ